jgi:restriction endonuclease S subunit
MNVKLSDIAKVQIGYQFRGEVEPVEDGRYRYIQSKDIDDLLHIRESSLVRVNASDADERFLVKNGDVLFSSRGRHNYATTVKKSYAETLASNVFYIVRSDSYRIHPEYLAWYINQEPAQNYLRTVTRGTNTLMVPKSELEELEIPEPSLDTQFKIIQFQMLADKERELLAAIKSQRSRVMKALALKLKIGALR